MPEPWYVTPSRKKSSGEKSMAKTKKAAPKKKTAKPEGKGPSKSQQARDYAKANPKASTQEIADATGLSYNAVYQALKTKKKGKRGRKKVEPATVATNGAAPKPHKETQLEHALNFIENSGGIDAAKGMIDRLWGFAKKSASKLPF